MNAKLIPAIAVTLLFIIFSCTEKKKYEDELSPEEALEAFELHEDFEIEIFATEPQVLDPVSMIFDTNGDAYVVEMPDYPVMPDSSNANGRIRILRDTDNDGKVDETHLFAEKLLDATSILPWKSGFIVTAAPHIIYLEDTDGDYKADKKEILFSGFFEHNSEAQITSLRYNIDNWIYAANHGQPGEVKYINTPDSLPPLSMRGADFRFRLDREEFGAATGHAQFGQDIDDFGNRYLTQNTIHIQQAVIPNHYLSRHGHLPSRKASLNISDHELEMFQLTPPPYWRAERTRRRNKTYQEQNLDRVEYAEDHFTGSSGGTVYAGDAFPEEYYGNIFTGEVAGNLVHRDILVPHKTSPVFVAQRHEDEMNKEFLATTDSWFRPSSLKVGPDGFLYVVDMYRQHIETPLSIPEDLQEDMDFDAGKEHGRIYRIKPKNHNASTQEMPNLKTMEPAEYVEFLAHPNRWWRLQAQRLLVEKQDRSVISDVENMLLNHEDARARLHALYVLEGLNALNSELVGNAVNDEDPKVRVHGIRLAEQYKELLPDLLKAVDDDNLQVVLQATLSIGQFNTPEVVTTLAKLAQQRANDSWFHKAILSSVPGSSVELLNELVNNTNFLESNEGWKTSFLHDLVFIIAAHNETQEVKSVLDMAGQSPLNEAPWKQAVREGLTKGLKRAGGSNQLKGIIEQLESDTTDNALQSLRNHYNQRNTAI